MNAKTRRVFVEVGSRAPTAFSRDDLVLLAEDAGAIRAGAVARVADVYTDGRRLEYRIRIPGLQAACSRGGRRVKAQAYEAIVRRRQLRPYKATGRAP